MNPKDDIGGALLIGGVLAGLGISGIGIALYAYPATTCKVIVYTLAVIGLLNCFKR